MSEVDWVALLVAVLIVWGPLAAVAVLAWRQR